MIVHETTCDGDVRRDAGVRRGSSFCRSGQDEPFVGRAPAVAAEWPRDGKVGPSDRPKLRCRLVTRRTQGTESMGLIIGMDEAGLGPNLGPFIVAATVWEFPGRSRNFDLFDALKDAVAPEPC